MVTSATPGLPMITVAAGALIRSTRAMFTFTVIGPPSWARADAMGDTLNSAVEMSTASGIRMDLSPNGERHSGILCENGEQTANADITNVFVFGHVLLQY